MVCSSPFFVGWFALKSNFLRLCCGVETCPNELPSSCCMHACVRNISFPTHVINFVFFFSKESFYHYGLPIPQLSCCSTRHFAFLSFSKSWTFYTSFYFNSFNCKCTWVFLWTCKSFFTSFSSYSYIAAAPFHPSMSMFLSSPLFFIRLCFPYKPCPPQWMPSTMCARM